MPTAPDIAHEIDTFEAEVELRRHGRMEDRVFAETRLRRGYYGQRYDNGQRHDGLQVRNSNTPNNPLTKGPHPLGRPGMQRIKIPFGGLNAAQLEVMAELAEEYSDGIATSPPARISSSHSSTLTTSSRSTAPRRRRHHHPRSLRQLRPQRHRCPFAGVCRTDPSTSAYARALALLPARPPRHQGLRP